MNDIAKQTSGQYGLHIELINFLNPFFPKSGRGRGWIKVVVPSVTGTGAARCQVTQYLELVIWEQELKHPVELHTNAPSCKRVMFAISIL